MRPSEHRLGVLFEISIVCHVFVFVVLADGWGFVFWLVRRVFSGSGFFWFLASSCFLAVWSWGVGGRVVGGFSRVRGWVRPVPVLCAGVGCVWRVRLLRFCAGVGCVCAWFLLPVGVGVGCVCASGSFLGCGFRGWVGRPGSCVLCGGWVCLVSCFVFAVFLVVFAEGFPGVFVSARRFLPLVWGVSGWVGVVFSPAVLPGPGSGWFLVGGWPGFGFGCWFCLESLILAQDERWRRA